jgi:hypothetical protein
MAHCSAREAGAIHLIYFGRGQTILDMRKEIKRRTMEHRRQKHFKAAA